MARHFFALDVETREQEPWTADAGEPVFPDSAVLLVLSGSSDNEIFSLKRERLELVCC